MVIWAKRKAEERKEKEGKEKLGWA